MRKVVLAVVVGALVSCLGLAALIYSWVEMVLNETPLSAASRFDTDLIRELSDPAVPMPTPVPDSLYQRAEYAGAKGRLWAWVSRPPDPQQRHPAIVWIVGGFPPGGLPTDAWLEQDPANDQSAAQYMRAGVVTLYPTTRGMEGNAGAQQSFLGEIADVVAAVDWLRAQPYVDPERVYVGGHSTGGTLSLLVGASTRVAGVISYGPIASVCNYPADELAFNSSSPRECIVRAPITYGRKFPPSVILEGEWSGAESVRELSRSPSKSSSYVVIPRTDHFAYVAAMNDFFAQKIVKREALSLTVDEAVAIMKRAFPAKTLESDVGWSISVPAGYQAIPEAGEAHERYFRNGPSQLRLSLQEETPVECLEGKSIKGRGKECFRYEPVKEDDGSELLYLTAQRGSSLFITVSGWKWQEQALLAELNLVLDGVKESAPGH